MTITMILRASLTIVALFLASCAIAPTSQSPQSVAVPAPSTEVWEYPASEFPTICILFEPNGTLAFRGGFLFFNRGSWKLNSATGNTEIFLGGSTEFPEAPKKEQLGKRSNAPLAYDGKKRKLEYRIDPTTEFIEFAGFVFYRKTQCSVD